MRAAVLRSPGEPLALRELPDPAPGPGQVRLAVSACAVCRSGRENLCEHARFTGRDLDGGYAELTVADERFCLEIPDAISDIQAAPLLCGGLIGFRAYRMAQQAERALSDLRDGTFSGSAVLVV